MRDVAGAPYLLKELLAQTPVLNQYELSLREMQDALARTARLEVRVTPVTLSRQKRHTPWLTEIDFQPLTMWVVEAREIQPPSGATPLHGLLYTSESITSFTDHPSTHRALRTPVADRGVLQSSQDRLPVGVLPI